MIYKITKTYKNINDEQITEIKDRISAETLHEALKRFDKHHPSTNMLCIGCNIILIKEETNNG